MEDKKGKDYLKHFFSVENRTKYFVHLLFYLCIVSIIVFSFLLTGNKPAEKTAANKENPFQKISIQAKGAIIWDVVNGRELFSKNPDMPLPLASLTKVMTAVTLDGKLENDQTVEITNEDLKPDGDSNLVVGDTWKARDLRDFTLLTSSNDGALALAAVAKEKEKPFNKDDLSDLRNEFVKEMNETAVKIGLSNSKFFNEHGLDENDNTSGAYGSARDMATLFEYTLKNYPEILEVTRYKNLEFDSAEKKYDAENTNVYIDKIPDVIASKTGFTDLAGGNLVVAFDAGLNRPIIVSVLGSTQEGRFEDALSLVNATMEYIKEE